MMLFKTSTKNPGFTLIELLVVIAIIGILSSVVLASLSGARESARDVQRQQDIRQMKTALEMYYNDYGKYPDAGGATHPNDSWSNSADGSWDTLESKLSDYISSLPKDPLNGSSDWAGNEGNYNYSYLDFTGGCGYMIVYGLENTPDKDTPTMNTCDNRNFEYGDASVRTVGVEG